MPGWGNDGGGSHLGGGEGECTHASVLKDGRTPHSHVHTVQQGVGASTVEMGVTVWLHQAAGGGLVGSVCEVQ